MEKGGFAGRGLRKASLPAQPWVPTLRSQLLHPPTLPLRPPGPGSPARSSASSQDGIQQKDTHNFTRYYGLNNTVIRSLETKGGKISERCA